MKMVYLMSQILILALAVYTVTASSAFALSFEPGLFLVAGAAASTQSALAEGELLLEDKKLGIGVVCSGMFNGHFEGSEDLLIVEVLNLAGTKFTGELGAEGILCKAETGCAESTDIEVWPLNLPWLFLPELDTETGSAFILLFADGKGAPAYEVKCLVLGISTEETCSTAEGSGNEVVNATGGVETKAGVSAEPNGSCTVGGAEAGLVTASTAGLLSAEAGLVSISTTSEPILSSEAELPTEEIEEAPYVRTVTYRQNGGPAQTGNLTVTVKGTGYTEGAGTTCLNLNLKNGESCVAEVKCTVLHELGEVEVKGTEAGITWWHKDLICR